jgi:hypothetical protein
VARQAPTRVWSGATRRSPGGGLGGSQYPIMKRLMQR